MGQQVLPQLCVRSNTSAVGAYPHPTFDMPNQGSGLFAFSQISTTSRGFEKRTVYGAGRQGIYANGTYPPLVRNTSLIMGWDITDRVRLAYENVRAAVECTGANFSTDVLYARSEFSTFGIDERPSGVVKNIRDYRHVYMRDLPASVVADLDNSDYIRVAVQDLPKTIKNAAYIEWRTIINTLRRQYLNQTQEFPRLMDARTLAAVEWLVNMDTFECGMIWEAPRCAATCKDVQVFEQQQ